MCVNSPDVSFANHEEPKAEGKEFAGLEQGAERARVEKSARRDGDNRRGRQRRWRPCAPGTGSTKAAKPSSVSSGGASAQGESCGCRHPSIHIDRRRLSWGGDG
jgi:hypothetical protein